MFKTICISLNDIYVLVLVGIDLNCLDRFLHWQYIPLVGIEVSINACSKKTHLILFVRNLTCIKLYYENLFPIAKLCSFPDLLKKWILCLFYYLFLEIAFK